jgi:hypothetical protein
MTSPRGSQLGKPQKIKVVGIMNTTSVSKHNNADIAQLTKDDSFDIVQDKNNMFEA